MKTFLLQKIYHKKNEYLDLGREVEVGALATLSNRRLKAENRNPHPQFAITIFSEHLPRLCENYFAFTDVITSKEN
jgi:hypothetical protein